MVAAGDIVDTYSQRLRVVVEYSVSGSVKKVGCKDTTLTDTWGEGECL